MTLRKPRIIYIGMVCTDAYVNAIKEDAFVGAASGKMSSVVSSLRLVGQRAILVSLPFVPGGAIYKPGRLCRADGFPAVFLPVLRSPAARKVVGSFTMALFALRRVRSHDTILFYNHAIEYALALVILRVRGIAVFQDIEDLPISAERGLRSFLNRLGYILMFNLASDRKVTVSNQVGKALNLRDFLPIQGVAAASYTEAVSDKWERLERGAPLRVHYGGSLTAATGLDLFCDAVSHLDANAESAELNIEFVVTGIGNLSPIRELASTLRTGNVSIDIHEGIEKTSYLKLLDSCHASLSLRNPGSTYSSTTFPSKVIEITSHGLSLVTTRVSDVGDIFSDNEVWFLPYFGHKALSDILRDMARRPAEVRHRANLGKALTQGCFTPPAIGEALTAFLNLGPKAT